MIRVFAPEGDFVDYDTSRCDVVDGVLFLFSDSQPSDPYHSDVATVLAGWAPGWWARFEEVDGAVEDQ